MGSKISEATILEGALRIRARDVLRLYNDGDHSMAECNFVEDLMSKAEAAKPSDELAIENFAWSGEGSGLSFGYFKKEVAPKLLGKADLLFTWEDGEWVEGYRLEDGKLTECDVQFVLTPKKKGKG